MATEVLEGPLGEWRSASTAGGGTALTTTAVRIPLPRGSKMVQLIPRNFATAVVAQFNTNPWLHILKTTDLLATAAAITDYSEQAQDLDTATDVDLSSLSTIAALDAVYVGALVPFRGVEIDVDAANANASVLTVKYWNGSAWTDITATDGTDAAGASMGADGNVTWTVPASWVSRTLVEIGDASRNLQLGILQNLNLYWTRWEFSAALDATTTQNSWIAMNRNTAYAELPAGLSQEFGVTVGPGGIFSVEAKTNAGTANLIVNCATQQGGRF